MTSFVKVKKGYSRVKIRGKRSTRLSALADSLVLIKVCPPAKYFVVTCGVTIALALDGGQPAAPAAWPSI
ncbi:hypothetical protein ES703_75775 [subsurface metagenome]